MRWILPGLLNDIVLEDRRGAGSVNVTTRVDTWVANPSTRRTIMEALRHIGALPARATDAELATALRRALDLGRLSASRVEQRRVVVELDPLQAPQELGPTEEEEKDWIEIELLTDKGAPVEGEPYLIELPDGSKREGYTNSIGRARETGIIPGQCKVSFPKMMESGLPR